MRTLLLMLLCAALVRAEPLRERVDVLANPYIESGQTLGMVVGVLEKPDGEPLFAGYGKGSPDKDTVYEIGSISKVFTGVLLAAMVQDGSVRLDQPVQELLPKSVTVPDFEGTKITLVDLSTHTSGLPRMPANFVPKDPSNPYRDYTAKDMYQYINAYTLPRAPKAQMAYSNLGAALLGHALELRAKLLYEELMKARITGPLGMKDTVVALTPELKKRLAPGHDAAGRPAANWDLPAFAGAGGIRSTAADMMRFLRANLAAADQPIHRALALARKPHFENKIGLGWHFAPSGAVWHNGQTGGYHSFAAVDPKRGTAVVVLSDTATGAPDELGGKLLRLLAGADVEPASVRKEVEVAEEILKRYEGVYALAPTFKLTVALEKGSLWVQATNQPKLPVFASSETKFFYKIVDAQIEFEVDKDGKTRAMVLHQGGGEHRAVKE